MGSSPHIPTPQAIPPPPQPASAAGAMPGGKPSLSPNLGGTFLTAAMPSAAPITKPKKTLLGY